MYILSNFDILCQRILHDFPTNGIQYLATRPTKNPVTKDAININGRYHIAIAFSIIILATINCPIL